MTGRIERFLEADHRRLDQLLGQAVADPEKMDLELYALFRSGLLRHISMEEKILLPAATELRGGEVLPIASRLRLDHGAIAALLVPSPTPLLIETLRSILAKHNAIEEGSRGLYADCDRLVPNDSSDLLDKLKAAPEVPVSPCNDRPTVMPAVARALRRAGYDAEADQMDEMRTEALAGVQGLKDLLPEASVFRQLVEAYPDAILVADAAGRIRFWNLGATRIFGYEAEEVLGQPLEGIIPESLRERHSRGYRQVIASGQTKYGDRLLKVPAVHRDGYRLSVEFNVALLFDADEKVVGIAAYLRDVTEAWKEAREMRERLRALEGKHGAE